MTDYTELKTAIEYILNQGALEREFIEDADALDAAWAVYEALGPTDILALIADIEDARNGMKHSCAIRLKKRIELLETQRDQLIADNERLTNRLEVDPRHDYDGISTRDATVKVLDEQVDQLKAENERLRADYAGLARFNPEWDRAAAAQDSVREHMAMVVQLKAEIAGLRTGYEAYERVNAELKQKVANLEVCQTVSLGMSGIIKCVAGELGFDAAGEDSAQDYLIGLARRASELKAENEALRKIISDSATSCGAAVSVECSLDFMAHLPVEIFSVISKLRNALAECSDSLHAEMLQKFGGQRPDDMHPVTRREYDRDMAEIACYRAVLSKEAQS